MIEPHPKPVDMLRGLHVELPAHTNLDKSLEDLETFPNPKLANPVCITMVYESIVHIVPAQSLANAMAAICKTDGNKD